LSFVIVILVIDDGHHHHYVVVVSMMLLPLELSIACVTNYWYSTGTGRSQVQDVWYRVHKQDVCYRTSATGTSATTATTRKSVKCTTYSVVYKL